MYDAARDGNEWIQLATWSTATIYFLPWSTQDSKAARKVVGLVADKRSRLLAAHPPPTLRPGGNGSRRFPLCASQ